MKKHILKYLISPIVLLSSMNLQAEEEQNKSVKNIGLSNHEAHVSIINDYKLPCLYNVSYFDIKTDFGKIAYSTLLSAKVSNQEIKRLGYTIDSSTNKCKLTFVQL